MKLSVVTSAYSIDRINDLKDLLDGLSNQTCKLFETIIVIDKNKELLERINEYIDKNSFKNMHIIFNPENKGLSYNRNIGIKNSSGDIIAFIDDDAIPFDNWGKAIIETFEEDENIGAVTGEIIPLWEHEEMSWFPKELHWMLSCSYVMTPTTKQEFERGFGTNMSFKREVFDRAGTFDTNLGINGKKWVGGEDTDMFLRVKKLGMKIIFHPDVCVKHKVYKYRIETKNLIKRAFNGGYSVALMKNELEYELSQSTENSYLKHLMFRFYPTKFLESVTNPSLILLKQAYVVTIVMFFEFSGFVYGICSNKL